MTRAHASTALVTALLLGAAAGPAAAGDDDQNIFDRHRTELGIGMLAGGFEVGPVGGPAVGVHLGVGRHLGPLLLLAEYNMLSVGESSYDDDAAVRGVLNRLGVVARYGFAEFGGRRVPVQGSFWLEGGVGRERVDWDGGGRLTRDDVALGFGAQANFVVDRRTDKPKYIGFYYAFRATIARGPDADAPGMPTCAAVCDEPTGPSPYDVGLFFNMGLSFGK